MYHTPNLTGLRKEYIPKRINEGWGLQHMKLYGIDDEIILSGYGYYLKSQVGSKQTNKEQGKSFYRLFH